MVDVSPSGQQKQIVGEMNEKAKKHGVSTRTSILRKDMHEENKQSPQTFEDNKNALVDPSNEDDVKLSSNIDNLAGPQSDSEESEIQVVKQRVESVAIPSNDNDNE